jgi:hypothetical protein
MMNLISAIALGMICFGALYVAIRLVLAMFTVDRRGLPWKPPPDDPPDKYFPL